MRAADLTISSRCVRREGVLQWQGVNESQAMPVSAHTPFSRCLVVLAATVITDSLVAVLGPTCVVSCGAAERDHFEEARRCCGCGCALGMGAERVQRGETRECGGRQQEQHSSRSEPPSCCSSCAGADANEDQRKWESSQSGCVSFEFLEGRYDTSTSRSTQLWDARAAQLCASPPPPPPPMSPLTSPSGQDRAAVPPVFP